MTIGKGKTYAGMAPRTALKPIREPSIPDASHFASSLKAVFFAWKSTCLSSAVRPDGMGKRSFPDPFLYLIVTLPRLSIFSVGKK